MCWCPMHENKPKETHCPFCAPSVGSAVFAEDPSSLALYNLSPILPGHVLIVPRRHVERVAAMYEAEWDDFWRFARKMASLVTACFHADGCDWTIQDGASAGQTVGHVHLHLIPRHTGDLPEPGDWYPKLVAQQSGDSSTRPRLTPQEMAKVVQYLRLQRYQG